MQYVGGEVYQNRHTLECMYCDAIKLEEHTYGSDDKCTVCGAERPCEHQWVPNGEQYEGMHVLVCTCGQTMHEPHSWTWNAAGKYAVCTVCETREGHWHKYFHPGGVVCIECGYNRSTGGSGTPPSGTEPAETEPAETEPAETKPAETEPAKTEPIETEPAETEPTETKPAEVASGEANPAETETEASETIDEEDGKVDSQSDGSTPVWVVAVVFVAAGLTIGLFLWKKKSA